MKKILILGANGGIGRNLVNYFFERRAENDIELLTADLESCKFMENRSKYYHIDIRKKEDFDVLPKDIYCVIDLATTMPARMVGFDPQKYIDTNISGTCNVLEFCRVNNVNRVLFAQTFGDILKKAETDPVLMPDMTPELDYNDTKSFYIATMCTAVDCVKYYHSIYNLRTFVFRLPTIYSWHNKVYCENGVITKQAWKILIDQAEKGEDIHVWGDPNRAKDMVYVKDLCQEFYKACFVDRDYGFYNIGTGVGITLLDQIKGMIEVFGGEKKSNILFTPEKPNAPQYIMNIDNARSELGYEPQYDYISMLRDMKKEREINRFEE